LCFGKRYAVREVKKWRYAVRNVKNGRYAVRKGERDVTLIGATQTLNYSFAFFLKSESSISRVYLVYTLNLLTYELYVIIIKIDEMFKENVAGKGHV